MAARRVLGLVVGGALVAGCGGGAAAQGAGDDVADPAPAAQTITALGVGRASAPPDAMVVSLSIHTDGDSAAETMDTASVRTQQVLDAARQQGVADEDLQTTGVSVFPRFNQTGTRVVGYSADNSFTVRYTDLATAGALLDGLVGVGGDFLRVQGLSLEIDDPTSVTDDARADAVRRARAQAGQLADAAGVELGDVRSVAEVPVGTTLPELDAGRYAAASMAADAAVPVPIAGGQQEVTVQVAVVYEIA